jgi:carbon monoxide dehydrogenase subunit G
MANNSIFESRTGRLSCTDAEFFGFITDIRNFGQFIPEGSIKNWHATADSSSFGVPPLSTVKVRITEKIPFSLVSFSGDALHENDFNLKVQINNNENKLAEINIILAADLNPVLKTMASKPIEKFLETLISEMEKFEKWNETFKESQPL